MVFINIEYFKFIVNIIQKEWRYKMIKSKTFVLALVLFSFSLIGLTACKSNLVDEKEERGGGGGIAWNKYSVQG